MCACDSFYTYIHNLVLREYVGVTRVKCDNVTSGHMWGAFTSGIASQLLQRLNTNTNINTKHTPKWEKECLYNIKNG